VIDEKIEALSALQVKAKTFRSTLNDEEAKSRMLQMHKN
jgi:predicted phage tail protein